MEDLNVSDNDLGEVVSELMGAVVARIKAVDLTDISLNSSQVTDICHAIQAADEELELEDLCMPMMVDELSQVDNDLLAGAVVRIRDVNMITNSPLSKAQTTTIFHAILAEKAGLIILIFKTPLPPFPSHKCLTFFAFCICASPLIIYLFVYFSLKIPSIFLPNASPTKVRKDCLTNFGKYSPLREGAGYEATYHVQTKRCEKRSYRCCPCEEVCFLYLKAKHDRLGAEQMIASVVLKS